MTEQCLNNVFNQFDTTSDITKYGNGHINDTFLVTPARYILQRINTNIFKDPEALMNNIVKVTEFLRDKAQLSGEDVNRSTLTVVKTLDGKNLYTDENKSAFRLYKFIEGTVTIDADKSNDIVYNTGVSLGKFQNLLSDFPAHELSETIKDFHNTPKRVSDFEKSVSDNLSGRASSVKEEIDFVLARKPVAGIICDGIKDGSLPLRVTHNDTKINNVLFDKDTYKGICVIDLDTVMPGSMLYDFGDALRYAGSTAAEDETDLEKVSFSKDAFYSFAKGFLETAGSSLTKRELELLPYSVMLMTYECGMRFLADYINGDIYFKTHYPEHNLDRARNQFKLVRDIENMSDELSQIIKDLTK